MTSSNLGMQSQKREYIVVWQVGMPSLAIESSCNGTLSSCSLSVGRIVKSCRIWLAHEIHMSKAKAKVNDSGNGTPYHLQRDEVRGVNAVHF